MYLQDVTRMNQLQLAFYFGDYQLAWKMVEATKDFEKTNVARHHVADTVFPLRHDGILLGTEYKSHCISRRQYQRPRGQDSSMIEPLLWNVPRNTSVSRTMIRRGLSTTFNWLAAAFTEWGALAKVDQLKQKWKVEVLKNGLE